jgi:hypothetical protein
MRPQRLPDEEDRLGPDVNPMRFIVSILNDRASVLVALLLDFFAMERQGAHW